MGKRQRIEYEAIPASLENAIEGITIVDRGITEGDDGPERRVLLLWAGETTASWHHSEIETQKRIKAGWPKLTEAQLNQVMKMLRGRIHAELRKAAAPSSATQHRGVYASWNPNEYLVCPPQGEGYDYY